MQEFTFAHSHSSTWNRMNAICREEGANLVGHLNGMAAKSNGSMGGANASANASAIIDFRMIVLKVGRSGEESFSRSYDDANNSMLLCGSSITLHYIKRIFCSCYDAKNRSYMILIMAELFSAAVYLT